MGGAQALGSAAKAGGRPWGDEAPGMFTNSECLSTVFPWGTGRFLQGGLKKMTRMAEKGGICGTMTVGRESATAPAKKREISVMGTGNLLTGAGPGAMGRMD